MSKIVKINAGSGKRKEARTDKNCGPRCTKAKMDVVGEEQIRMESTRRWPTKEQEEKYFELNMLKKQRGRANKNRVKPPEFGFALLESLPTAQLKRLLICSCLTLKATKRYPNWILQRTYNLKSRPVNFS